MEWAKSISPSGDPKMGYRFTILSLVAALMAPSLLESAPAPGKTYPAVYALMYVGKGKNDKANAKRVAAAATEIADSARTVWDDPEVLKLSVAKEKKRDELSEWMKTKIRVATLEGTSVLRVWLADGTPEEQAVIINATLRFYQKLVEKERQNLRASIDTQKRAAKQAGVLQQFETELQEREEEYNSFPRLLEWAAVKGKR
jgi:hypothetical protein